MKPPVAQAPSEDKRWRIVNATLRRHGYVPDALIEALHAAQEAFGYLDLQAMHYIADQLMIPLSRVYGVATFYNAFILKPQGEHTCVLCMGTACYVKGAAALMNAAIAQAGIRPGETTPDGKASLVVARCLGACGIAPAGVFDGEVRGNLSPEILHEQLESWMEP